MTVPTRVTFEDALTMTGFGRFNLAMLLVCASVICAVNFEAMSVAYLVPANACELNTTSTQQGFMAGIPLIGILLSSNIWGYLADTQGRRKILFIATSLTFFTAASATLSPNWIVFCVLKFLSASSVAGCFGLAYTLISECTPVHRRFTFIQLLISVTLLTAGAMAALAMPILPLTFSYVVPYLSIQFNSWRILNIIYSLPCAVAALCLYFAPESPKFLLSKGNEEESLAILRKIYTINNCNGDYKVTSVHLDEDSSPMVKGFWSSVVSQTTPLFKPPLLKTTLLLGTLFVIIYICSNPYTVWVPYMFDGFMKSLEKGDRGLNYCEMFRSSKSVNTTDHFQEVKDCSLNNTAMMMLVGMNIFLAIINGLFSLLLRWLSRKRLLIGLQLTAGVAGLTINFSTNWMLTALLFIIFYNMVLNFGLLSTFSVDLFPTYVKAMAVCLTLMMGRGSAVVGINLLKDMLDHNCELSFYIFGGLAFVGGLIAGLLPMDKKKNYVDSNKVAEI